MKPYKPDFKESAQRRSVMRRMTPVSWLTLGVVTMLAGLAACTAVDRASTSQIASQPLGAVLAATAGVRPVSTGTSAPVVSATPVPETAVPTFAPAIALPAATALVEVSATVPWAGKLELDPTLHDPDGFNYKAPPEVVDMLSTTITEIGAESAALNTPELAANFGGVERIKRRYGEPALSKIIARNKRYQESNRPIDVGGVTYRNLVILGMRDGGVEAKASFIVNDVTVKIYDRKTLKFLRTQTYSAYMQFVTVKYDMRMHTWVFTDSIGPGKVSQ